MRCQGTLCESQAGKQLFHRLRTQFPLCAISWIHRANGIISAICSKTELRTRECAETESEVFGATPKTARKRRALVFQAHRPGRAPSPAIVRHFKPQIALADYQTHAVRGNARKPALANASANDLLFPPSARTSRNPTRQSQCWMIRSQTSDQPLQPSSIFDEVGLDRGIVRLRVRVVEDDDHVRLDRDAGIVAPRKGVP
jgi:hypothetical protein